MLYSGLSGIIADYAQFLDFMSDDAYKGSATSDGLSTQGPYDNFTFSTSQDGLDRWYTALYQGVKAANVVIDKVPEIKMHNP